jgi:hypothetical protein
MVGLPACEGWVVGRLEFTRPDCEVKYLPYADPEKSFDAAVNHLFRHLADASALRKNPLTSAFFTGAKTKTGDAGALFAIRNRIACEADACCSDAAITGSGEGARRQRAIIQAILSGDDIAPVAKRLQLSRRQYYRERHAICSHIAQRMRPAKDTSSRISAYDSKQLLFNRASAFCDQGLGTRAVALLDHAWTGFSPGHGRLTAGLELADALIVAGQLPRARKLLDRSAVDIETSAGDEWTALSERAALVEARYALALGSDATAAAALEELVNRQTHAQRVDDLALDALVESGLLHCANARFSPARKTLGRANVVASKIQNLAPHRRVSLALLNAYCAEDLADEYRGSYQRFSSALELSIANASVRGALESTIGLMGYYGSVGRNDEMLTMAERALELARATEGQRYLVFAAAWIATTLLKTPYWQAADPLVFEAERIALPGTLHWTFLKEAQADFFAHTARYANAEQSFAEAGKAASTLQNKKWQAIVLRDSGLMLKRIGSLESADSMRRAVELAESAAGAWTLSLTYRAASEVLPEARPARQKQKVTTAAAVQRKRSPGLSLLGGVAR